MPQGWRSAQASGSHPSLQGRVQGYQHGLNHAVPCTADAVTLQICTAWWHRGTQVVATVQLLWKPRSSHCLTSVYKMVSSIFGGSYWATSVVEDMQLANILHTRCLCTRQVIPGRSAHCNNWRQ
jgi:hypothetical protein